MKRHYFIHAEFYTPDRKIDKFINSIVELDLSAGEQLPEIAKRLIKEHFPEINFEYFTVKVISFNNIEI